MSQTSCSCTVFVPRRRCTVVDDEEKGKEEVVAAVLLCEREGKFTNPSPPFPPPLCRRRLLLGFFGRGGVVRSAGTDCPFPLPPTPHPPKIVASCSHTPRDFFSSFSLLLQCILGGCSPFVIILCLSPPSSFPLAPAESGVTAATEGGEGRGEGGGKKESGKGRDVSQDVKGVGEKENVSMALWDGERGGDRAGDTGKESFFYSRVPPYQPSSPFFPEPLIAILLLRWLWSLRVARGGKRDRGEGRRGNLNIGQTTSLFPLPPPLHIFTFTRGREAVLNLPLFHRFDMRDSAASVVCESCQKYHAPCLVEKKEFSFAVGFAHGTVRLFRHAFASRICIFRLRPCLART